MLCTGTHETSPINGRPRSATVLRSVRFLYVRHPVRLHGATVVRYGGRMLSGATAHTGVVLHELCAWGQQRDEVRGLAGGGHNVERRDQTHYQRVCLKARRMAFVSIRVPHMSHAL